jgi:hypothetical protein
MNTKAFILEFTVIFMITFVVASLVSFGWNYLSAGMAECNWSIAAQFALIFGILCPVIDMMRTNRSS